MLNFRSHVTPGKFVAEDKGTEYVIQNSRFGWIAYAHTDKLPPKLLTSGKSINSKQGAIADCIDHQRRG